MLGNLSYSLFRDISIFFDVAACLFLDDEHVDFQSLYQAVQSANHKSSDNKDPDTISIIEVESLVSL